MATLAACLAVWATGCALASGAATVRHVPPLRPDATAARVGHTCTRTVGPHTDLQDALRNARGGAVVCLRAGRYAVGGQIYLSHITPSATITLRPVPGAKVKLGWLELAADVRNLTVEGLVLTRGAADVGPAANVTFSGNTVSGADGATSGFYFYGDGGLQRHMRVLGNRMSYLAPPDLAPPGAGQCVTVSGGGGQERDFDISHNVCGPGIGDHYVQIGGIDGLTADYNEFLGPAAPEALQDQAHNNVLQIFGDSENVEFSHNVIRGSESRGQEILIEEGRFVHMTVDDNLFVGSPRCLRYWNCYSYALGMCAAEGLQFQSNTVIGYHWGVQVTHSGGSPGCLTSGRDYQVTNNIVVGTNDNADITYGECERRCVFDYNVTSDRSARQGGARHYVIDWRPRWTNRMTFRPKGLPFQAGSPADIG